MKNIMRNRWALPCLLLIAAAADAQTSLVAHLTEGNKRPTINEVAKSEAPVSGHFDVVGASIGTPADKDASRLFVRVPGDWKGGKVCVEITTRNGLYEAADVFDVPMAARGAYVKLDFRTDYPAFYSGATRETFAVTARAGPCTAFGSVFLPTAWTTSPPPAPETKLVLAIQTGRAMTSVLIGTGGKSQRITCNAIEARDTTAFDAICIVPLASSDQQVMTVQIEKCAFDECTRGETIRLGL